MDKKHQQNVIDTICSIYRPKDIEFMSTKCLTYIDEFEQNLEENKKATSLVSITSSKEHYINYIEKEWLINIRNKYNFKMGEPIHFTKVRKIAQNVTFNIDGEKQESIGWNDDYILYRANSLINYDKKDFKEKVKAKNQRDFVEEYRVWKLFRKEDESGFGTLDVKKLENFYEDIFTIIKNSKFNILCTSLLYDKLALHRKSNRFASDQVKSAYTIAFGEHLDLLCFYLKNGFYSDEELDINSLKSLSTKLRWDGDDGFNPRNDYRLLFNRVISSGTTHYQSETVRKCLDEIRFINKSEIGYYDNLENPNIVSHIGCDIADFIAYFVGKYSIKDEIINMYRFNGDTQNEAYKKFKDSVTFKIGTREFSPFEEVLVDKILKTDSYTSIQVIKECHYNIW